MDRPGTPAGRPVVSVNGTNVAALPASPGRGEGTSSVPSLTRAGHRGSLPIPIAGLGQGGTRKGYDVCIASLLPTEGITQGTIAWAIALHVDRSSQSPDVNHRCKTAAPLM
jgi:hypothetical protein